MVVVEVHHVRFPLFGGRGVEPDPLQDARRAAYHRDGGVHVQLRGCGVSLRLGLLRGNDCRCHTAAQPLLREARRAWRIRVPRNPKGQRTD